MGFIACASHPLMVMCFRYHAVSFFQKDITPEDLAYKGRDSIEFNSQGDWLSVLPGQYLVCNGPIWLERNVLDLL